MKRIQAAIAILVLAAVTGLAMAYASGGLSFSGNPRPEPPGVAPPVFQSGPLSIRGSLVQDKIYGDGPQEVSYALTLAAGEVPGKEPAGARHVDMVVVLDVSGSMDGEKIASAKAAVLELMGRLTPKDRFALVTYSNSSRVACPLVPMDPAQRNRLAAILAGVYPGGGTNLGEGLETGMGVLAKAPTIGNLGRVVLVSDGRANQGVTEPAALASLAAGALGHEFAVSTVGVGQDFNESLMTAIADSGTGRYYYLDEARAFAAAFAGEYNIARTVAASNVAVHVPLKQGVNLVSAGGYPITHRDGEAVFHPGDIPSGGTRTLFLTFLVPGGGDSLYNLPPVYASYVFKDKTRQSRVADPIVIARARSRSEAVASVDKLTWEEKVLNEEFGALQEAVSMDIRNGRREAAHKKIEDYRERQQTLNMSVGSGKVAGNLDEDLPALAGSVDEAFKPAAPAEAEAAQKAAAKDMQYRGYQLRKSF